MFTLKKDDTEKPPILMCFQEKPSDSLKEPITKLTILESSTVNFLSQIALRANSLSDDELQILEKCRFDAYVEADSLVIGYVVAVPDNDKEDGWESWIMQLYDEICELILAAYWKNTAAGRQEYDQLRMEWIPKILCEGVTNEGFMEAVILTGQDAQRGCFRVTSRLQSIVTGTKRMLEKFTGVL